MVNISDETSRSVRRIYCRYPIVRKIPFVVFFKYSALSGKLTFVLGAFGEHILQETGEGNGCTVPF